MLLDLWNWVETYKEDMVEAVLATNSKNEAKLVLNYVVMIYIGEYG